jgi:hypothetical protein
MILRALMIAVLAAIALLHAYWGFGGRWPGTDDRSLSALVIGRAGRMPGLWACLAVSAALLMALGAVAIFPRISAVYWGAACVFLLRGAATYVTPVFAYARDTPFHRLNRLAYAPLCLAIAAGFAINANNVLGKTP